MTDEDALLAAVRAAPGDHLSRLVYADWLEERGDPRAGYIRLLCAWANWSGDQGDRLAELRAGLDRSWVELMHEGVTRGGLGRNGWSGAHCEVRLNDGTELRLHVLTQWLTYAGLLEGTPGRESNDQHIESALAEARERGAGGRVRLIDPPRRDYYRTPGDMARIRERTGGHHVPEWLPGVTCIGWFGDVYSELGVVWFQDDYAPPIAGPVLDQIRALGWAREAAHWTENDL